MIGAVNPYQLHSQATIARLTQAGLGYWVADEELGEKTQRIGKVPLRNLVYRVHPLCDALKQLVWEFGAIDPKHESKIILEKLKDFSRFGDDLQGKVYTVLTTCQDFMRNQCSEEAGFVSLRDVERACDVLDWFLTTVDGNGNANTSSSSSSSSAINMTEHFAQHFTPSTFASQPLDFEQYARAVRPVPIHTQAVILSVAVAYRSRLIQKQPFDAVVGDALQLDPDAVRDTVMSYEMLFASQLNLPPASARNQALRENAFMGIVCLQLAIPVFFIGKPGSSKTLAKTAIENTLTSTHRGPLFEPLKPVTMLTFQCAPHTTSHDILLTFDKAARLPGRAVRAVCLDEVKPEPRTRTPNLIPYTRTLFPIPSPL